MEYIITDNLETIPFHSIEKIEEIYNEHDALVNKIFLKNGEVFKSYEGLKQTSIVPAPAGTHQYYAYYDLPATGNYCISEVVAWAVTFDVQKSHTEIVPILDDISCELPAGFILNTKTGCCNEGGYNDEIGGFYNQTLEQALNQFDKRVIPVPPKLKAAA